MVPDGVQRTFLPPQTSSNLLNIEICFIYVVAMSSYIFSVWCFYVVCTFFPFAAKPVPAVTVFVAQLAILELLDNVCIPSFQYLDVIYSFYVLIKDINIFK